MFQTSSKRVTANGRGVTYYLSLPLVNYRLVTNTIKIGLKPCSIFLGGEGPCLLTGLLVFVVLSLHLTAAHDHS